MNTSQSYKKYLVALVSASLVVPGTVFAQEATIPVFSDMEVEGEGLDVINKLVSTGIINGFPDNTFRPNASISREHAALMMYRALKLEGAKDVVGTLSVFDDVDPYHRSAVEIAAVVEAGIFKGYDGKLNMNDVISRQEMASVIVRTFGLTLDGEPVDFTDEDTIHVSHKEAVKILQSQGVLLGMPEGEGFRFGARDELTRLGFALMLSRSIDRVEELLKDEEEIGEEELPEVEVPVDEEEEQGEELEEETEEEEQVAQPVPVVPVVPGPGGGTGPGVGEPEVEEPIEGEKCEENCISFKVVDPEDTTNNHLNIVLNYIGHDGELINGSTGGYGFSNGKVALTELPVLIHDPSLINQINEVEFVAISNTHLYEGSFTIEEYKGGKEILLTKSSKDYTTFRLHRSENSILKFISVFKYFKNYNNGFGTYMNSDTLYIPNGEYSITVQGEIDEIDFLSIYDKSTLDGEDVDVIIDEKNLKLIEIHLEDSLNLHDLKGRLAGIGVLRYRNNKLFTGELEKFLEPLPEKFFIDKNAKLGGISVSLTNSNWNGKEYSLGFGGFEDNQDKIFLDGILSLKTSDRFMQGMEITHLSDIKQILDLHVVDSNGNRLNYMGYSPEIGTHAIVRPVVIVQPEGYQPVELPYQEMYFDKINIDFIPYDFTGELKIEVSFPDHHVKLPPNQTFVFNVVSEEEFIDLPSTQVNNFMEEVTLLRSFKK